MTKSELQQALADDQNLSISAATSIVNTILQAMTTALVNGENVEIRGFGSFTIRHYQSYTGKNPKTSESTIVKPKKLPFFKVGKELREQVNAASK